MSYVIVRGWYVLLCVVEMSYSIVRGLDVL